MYSCQKVPKHIRNYANLLKISICFVLFFSCIQQVFAQPTITSFSPSSGSIGTVVTITGTNFNTNASNNVVYFGGVIATVSSATTTSLTVTVPSGATYQPISVTNNNLVAYSKKPFLVTFSTAGTINAGTFAYNAKADSTSGIETTDLKYGDFDNDGKIDLAVVDRLNNTLSIYKNTSSATTISFAAKIDYITGSAPYNLNIGDLDGDGKLDIIVSNQNSNSVSIYKNTSSLNAISFNSKIDFTTGTQPGAIAVADIDNDGKLDLSIVCIDLAGTISFLINTSTGSSISFATKFDIAVGGTLNNIAAGDFNNDGKIDIVATNFTTNRLTILQNNSNGSISFGSSNISLSYAYPKGLAVADIDGDDKLDIITVCSTSSMVVIYRNTSSLGSMAFANGNSFYTNGGNPVDVAVGELDGDGKPDIAVLKSYDGILVFKNKSNSGSLSFDLPITYISLNINGKIALSDLNGDSKSDISVLQGIYRVVVWQNKIGEPYISSISSNIGAAGSTITISGFNFTGTTAVSFGGVPAASFTVVNSTTITGIVGSGGSGNVSITTPLGVAIYGGFSYYIPPPAPTIISFSPTSAGNGALVAIRGTNFTNASSVKFGGVAASYFNVINSTTINAAVAGGATGSIEIITPGGTASAAGFTFIPVPNIVSFTPTSAANGQNVSIIGTNFSTAIAVSFGGVPAASFMVVSSTNIIATILEGSTGSISVTTIGGVANAAGFTYIPPLSPIINSFSPVFGNQGTIVTIIGTNFSPIAVNNTVYFGAVKAIVSAATPTSLTVIVPNGTTYQPISVTTNYRTAFTDKPFLVTFPGGVINPTSFESPLSFGVGSSPESVAIGDYDNDGKPDLATVNTNDYGISILRNTSLNGSISFASKVNFFTNISPWDITNADIDGDGKLDIAVVNHSSNSLHYFSLLRNISTLGNINFDPYISNTSLSEEPNTLAFGDLDGDGKTDLAIGTRFHVSVFKNTSVVGNISFSTKKDFNGHYFIKKMAIGDIDGDGKPDIAVVNEDSLTIMRNTSSGGIISFSDPINFVLITAGSPYFGSYGISISDFDNDGKPDIAIANNVSNHSVSIFKNISTPGIVSFLTPINYSTGSVEPILISANDLDGDGKPDIACTNGSGFRTISIMENTCPTGTISFSNAVNFTDTNAYWLGQIVTGDLNGDNMPEIIVTSSNTISQTSSVPFNSVFIYKNKTSSYLPIELTSFNALCTNKGIKLVWITATEVNNERFDIEKSANGSSWSLVTSIKAVGNSYYPNNYAFTDDESGNQFYRLKQIDKEGKFTYSHIVNANCKVIQSSLYVYPIPATNILNIVLPVDRNGKVDIQIIDILGKSQKQRTTLVQKGNNNIALSIADLSAGTYVLRVIGENFVKTEKILVER